MSDGWRPGETRFLGLPRRRAWVAALLIALVVSCLLLALFRVFGMSWIAAIVTAGITFGFLWLGQMQWLPAAWWLAGRSADEEEKRRRR